MNPYLKAGVIGAVVLPLFFLVWFYGAVGISSGMTGMEPLIFALPIVIIGFPIGAIIWYVVELVKSKLNS